jgi:hypothetical protein
MVARLLVSLLTLSASVPAWANGATPLPEGSNLTLFAIGIAGVLIGRLASARRKRD